jgi:hypothetical protein
MNTIGTLLHLPIAVGERYLWTLPMFHANGWTYTWTVTAAGGTHICLPRTDPALIFELIRDERVSWLSAAPTVLISLAHAGAGGGDVPRGVRVVTAGAPPAAATIERLEGEFGWEVTQVYGLTETAPFITVCAPVPEHEGLAPADRAVIKARTGVELITSGELRVVGPDGAEVPADGQTVGEIVVRGNVVMEGYYNDPEATKRAMGDGWFHTGDAAVVHQDGYAEIRDRLKDVIISGGENISSVEVEGVLLRHPAVQEVAIVGLPHERWGETPHAFAVLAAGSSATAEDLIEFAREHLAHFKAPTGVTFVAELPKTATGKIQKYVLRGGGPAISRQLPCLPAERLGGRAVLEQLGLVEPERDLVRGLVLVAGGVHQVRHRLAPRGSRRLGLVREVTADGSWRCLIRVGGADDLPHGEDGVRAFQHERDHRAALHELGRRVVDLRAEPFLQVEVVLAGELRVQRPHLHPDDLELSVFEALQDAPGKPARYGVWLENDERAFQQLRRVGHVAPFGMCPAVKSE